MSYILASIIVAGVVAWILFAPRPKRHDLGKLPPTYRSPHLELLDEELRQERARSGRG